MTDRPGPPPSSWTVAEASTRPSEGDGRVDVRADVRIDARVGRRPIGAVPQPYG